MRLDSPELKLKVSIRFGVFRGILALFWAFFGAFGAEKWAKTREFGLKSESYQPSGYQLSDRDRGKRIW